MSKKLLTKVAKGVAYGDVSNVSVRNILTELSKRIAGRFTEQEMYDTLEFFDWRCPYTGKDLKPLIENDLGGYAADHIYPQNRKWCGLNVKGNLIIVDKKANARKQDQDIETFLLTDTKVIKDLDEQGLTREERLNKIRDFQKLCGYDPNKIRQEISPILSKHYDAVRAEQEKQIGNALTTLAKINVLPISTPTISEPFNEARKTTTKTKIEILFYPSDEQQFKNELLNRKLAFFVLTYDSGAVKKSPWKVTTFNETSSLRSNIESRPFWRNRKKEGLVKVEVIIADEYYNGICSGNGADVSDIYIRYEAGWQSFQQNGEHVSGYCIENDMITIFSVCNFVPSGKKCKKIAAEDMEELISILDEAQRGALFQKSNTAVRAFHSGLCTYEYSYNGVVGNDCGSLFTDTPKARVLQQRYTALLQKLLK